MPVAMHASLYRQRVAQQRLGLVARLLGLQGSREFPGCAQRNFVLGTQEPLHPRQGVAEHSLGHAVLALVHEQSAMPVRRDRKALGRRQEITEDFFRLGVPALAPTGLPPGQGPSRRCTPACTSCMYTSPRETQIPGTRQPGRGTHATCVQSASSRHPHPP